MYCSKCGKQIGDDNQFCIGCGTRVSNPVGNENSHTQYSYKTKEGISSNKLVTIVICLGAAALNVFMLLTTWISVPSLSGWGSLFGTRTQSEFKLVEIYSFAEKADSILGMNETSWIKFTSLVILLLAIITIICLGIFCIKLITNLNNSINIGKASFTLSIILPIIVYIIIYMINMQANSGREDLVISLLETTFSPLVVLLTGCIGRYNIVTRTD